MGKSLFIQRMAEQLSIIKQVDVEQCRTVIPIHGPVVTSDVLLNFLKDHYGDNACMIYHFDIAPNVRIRYNRIVYDISITTGVAKRLFDSP